MAEEPPTKRFRYATYTEKLGAISVDVGKRKGLSWEKEEFGEEEQSKTPLTVELARLELHDLTLPYQELARGVYPLTRTLPMTLLNLGPVFEVFAAFFARLQDGQDHQNSGLDSGLVLLQALYETCLGETVAYVPDTVAQLVRVGALRALEPKLVERTYSTLSLVLRTIAPALLKVEQTTTLRAAWGHVRPYLGPSNKAYVRKCIADAWAGVLRKARNDALVRLMGVLLEEDTQGMEAVWANAIKGTSGHLHSRALPIYTVLIDELAANPTEEATAMLRRISTALVHHCSSGETAPLVDAVLARVAPATPSSSKKATRDLAPSTAVLDVLCAFLFTRKGKRFPNSQIKPAMLKLQSLVPEVKIAKGDEASAWRRAVTSAVVGTLAAGHLAEWLSPGVALIDSLWGALSTPESFAFVNMCIAFKWAGVEQFLLAHIARSALTGLKDDPLPTLVLLNNLAASGFLSGGLSNVQGGRWRATLVTALVTLLQSIVDSQIPVADVRVLGLILKLVPFLANESGHFAPHILALLDLATGERGPADAEAAKEDYVTSGAWNSTHIAGRILACLYQLAVRAPAGVQQEIESHFTTKDVLNVLLQKWHWSREVMEQVADFKAHWPETKLATANVELLYPNLMSADSSLRRSTLHVLAVFTRSRDKESSNVWDLSLTVEKSEMSLKNVRERTSNIARLTRYLQGLSNPSDTLKATILHALTHLVGQLKVNFRPIWAEVVTSLTALATQRADSIWEIVWAELQQTIVTDKGVMPDLDVVNPEWTKQKIDQEEEEDDDDHEFRCGALVNGRNAVSRAWGENNDTHKLDVAEIKVQVTADRLDVLSYESQLLAVLTATPSMAEKHTRTIVPVMLAIAGADDNTTVVLSHLSTRLRQARTISFLELFAKFVNPKAAFRSAELHTLYLDLLSKGEPKVQAVALNCLLTFKSPNLTPYGDRLRSLLEDSKFRDELLHLELGVESNVIEPAHRPEFLDVAIRLLYGIMMSRRARSSTAQGQGARKQAVLTSLSGCAPSELKTLVDLMLVPFASFDDVTPENLDSTAIVASGRQQLGFLTFLQDVLRYLGPQLMDHWNRLLGVTIVLVSQAQAAIDAEKDEQEKEGEDADEDVEDEAEDDKDDKGAAPLRSIRSMGLKRLVQFMRASVIDYDFTPFLQVIFKSIISPRLARLEVENTQAPSGTLELIAAFASNPDTASALVKYDDRTLPKTFACMTAVKVKPAVIGRVFDVIDSLLNEDGTVQGVVLPHIRPLLDNIIELVAALRASANEEIMRRLLTILSRLSVIVTDGTQAQQLATLLCPMLRQPGKQVPEKAKVNILTTLQTLYSISPDFADPTSTFFTQSYDLISNLFQSLYHPASRRALVAALRTFSDADPTLKATVDLVSELNAYRAKRLDEPDFDKRLDAFAKLHDAPEDELPQTAREWLPILRSVLFFIQEPEELSIRTNAGGVLRRFIDLVGEAEEGPLVDALQFVIMPSLRRTLLSKIELVRNEVLLVIAHAVRTSPIPALSEMRVLLGDEDETNIFVNIAHIQVHRRARAVRRLRELVAESDIREVTLSTIWLPILQHIVGGATDVTDHHLVNESIISIGALSGKLSWSRYNALLMRFLRLGGPKGNGQRFWIRCVSAIIDNFHFDLKSDETVGHDELAGSDKTVETLEDTIQEEVEDEEEKQVSPTDRITQVVLTRLLPALGKFVSEKSDETDDAVRIPLALGIVKLACALPEDSSDHEILRVITTVSQILRSKDQDTRDIARNTVGHIAVYLGPSWLVRVLRELKTALQRGPQLHTLAVTTHFILVQATTEAGDKFANLDAAVEDAVSVAAEVIWGESGKDVATEGFKTKMREVRGAASRGDDTFQLISRLVSPAKLSAVLTPVREIMHVSQAVKTMQQVDEVLRRVAIGLNANSMLAPQDILNLCFSLINGNSQYLKPKKKEAKQAKTNADRFTVQLKRKVEEDVDVYPQNAYKFVLFGLELFVNAFRRGKFDFDDVEILARLGPLVNAVGNTLYSPNASILVLGLKATAAVAKCPVPQVDDALPAFVTNIFKIIKNAGGTAEGDVPQTALKTLAVLIRDCKATQVSDNQLRYLLEVVAPDLEDHERQSAIFTVLRAVVSRRFVVPEIYDLMERVSSIMVTSQSSHVQGLCRGVLMQFLLDYPQGAGRLKSQMTFLARNLDYVFETGRVSVMEVLAAVFNKFSGDLLAEYADLFFVALVAVVANDDSEKCRNMAGALLQQLYMLLEEPQQARTLQVLSAWVSGEDDALASAALAVYGLLCEADGAPESLFAALPSLVLPVIATSAKVLAAAETAEPEYESAFAPEVTLDHARPQAAFSVLAKALRAPGVAEVVDWDDIVAHLLFPHEWVRFGAARALAIYFAASGEDAISALGPDLLLDIARKSCILLGGSQGEDGSAVIVDAKLADQLVKLLWNIAKSWAVADKAEWDSKKKSKIEAVAGDEDAEDGDSDEEDEEDEAEAEKEKEVVDQRPLKDEDDVTGAMESPTGRPLAWLMSRMSFLARRLIITRPAANDTLPGQPQLWTGPVMCILRFFAGIYGTFDRRQAAHFLVHLLSPVYRVLDEGGDLANLDAAGTGIDELRDLATEVREFVQTRVGTSAFSKSWERLRRRVSEVRAGRREKRARMAVADPRAWAARQEKRGERKKESKKRRVHAYMDGKGKRARRG